ncbi:MAG: hemerythrin [Ramlibacter sp.]|jgi:hypothetical protein|nr:hemerythrin [Ramlibacter sp.]MDB5914816.1 hemerythrin [Ramlibacter sp.]
MAATDKFRTQHDEILALAGEITGHLQGPEPDPQWLRKQLSGLAGKVNFHLAMEDQALYPRLAASPAPGTCALAARFQKEMGGLARVFTDYNKQWQVGAIRADLQTFATDTRKVFGALAHRIARENEELYPLADA